MIGYNVSWAAFSIVEVMSQPRFAHKRIGYLAANQVFLNLSRNRIILSLLYLFRHLMNQQMWCY